MGFNPMVALETKDITNEFWQTLCQYSFNGRMPAKGEAVEVCFGGGDEQFVMTLKRKGTEE